MYLDTSSLRKSIFQAEDKWQRLCIDTETKLEESIREILFENNYRVEFAEMLDTKDTDLNFKVKAVRFNKVTGDVELTGIQGKGIFSQSIEGYRIEDLTVYQLLHLYEEITKTINHGNVKEDTQVQVSEDETGVQ